MTVRRNDPDKHFALRRKIMHGDHRGIPSSAKFSHVVWGVSIDGNQIANVDGRCFIPRNPVPVYLKANRLGF